MPFLNNSISGKAKNCRGFALVAALLATMIIMALGVLALLMSSRDILISGRVVSEKKAYSAAEAGVHQLISNFNPEDLSASETSASVDASDLNCVYSVGKPQRPTSGPDFVPLAGYSIGGGQQWGQTTYVAAVTGEEKASGSTAQIAVGLGYGPIEFTTMSR